MKKLKVAFYFNNFGFKGLDLAHPESGNPGIGGTQFNFITLPYYFDQFYPGIIEWTLIGQHTSKFPDNIQVIHIEEPGDLEQVLANTRFDYFLWKPANTTYLHEILEKNKQNAIAWCNNIPGPRELNSLAKTDCIKQVVFAGHEALDVIRDHHVIKKSWVINNGFDPLPFQSTPNEKDPDLVVFMGSLIPGKCFHLLAKAWPKVIEAIPQAKLKVIGSGQLYNRTEKVGPLGLAEESYEKEFTTPLKYGESIHPSVEFLGILGTEKVPLLKSASVGVINPHGKSEVCPGSAMELMACETPVVAGGRYGNLDIIKNNETGILVKNTRQLSLAIIKLLKDPGYRANLGSQAAKHVASNFSQQRITAEWKALFEDLAKEKSRRVYPMKRNWNYNFKIIFELLRILKFRVGIFRKIPSIYEYIETRKGNRT